MSSGDKKLSRRELFARLRPGQEPRGAVYDEVPQTTPALPESNFDLLGLLQRIEGNQERAVKSRVLPVLRPPGAIDETTFLAECTRCMACIEACPWDAIGLAGPQMRGAEGTPVLHPLQSPCKMCTDTPCITACQTPREAGAQPSGVLVQGRGFRMGKASIKTSDCMAHQGGFCSTCSERCPVSGAIEVTLGKPKIVAEHCTGCGICHHVCPAPWNAIIVMPELMRPPRGSQT